MFSSFGSTGDRNATDSGSCLYIFSSVGISACRSSSGLNTLRCRFSCTRFVPAPVDAVVVLVLFAVCAPLASAGLAVALSVAGSSLMLAGSALLLLLLLLAESISSNLPFGSALILLIDLSDDDWSSCSSPTGRFRFARLLLLSATLLFVFESFRRLLFEFEADRLSMSLLLFTTESLLPFDPMLFALQSRSSSGSLFTSGSCESFKVRLVSWFCDLPRLLLVEFALSCCCCCCGE